MDLEERRRRADANAVAAFTLAQARFGDPRSETARFGAVEAVAIGVGAAFYNPVLALDPASTPSDVLAAIAWVEAKGLPVSVQVRSDVDPGVPAAVEGLGMVADSWATPVMVLESIPPGPPAPVDVAIRTGGTELFDDFHAAIESGEIFRRVFGFRLVADPRVRLAVGYLDGAPVSGAAALLYQVVWQRALFSVYGVNIESITIVVTGFMLGLGLGSLLGGQLSLRTKLPFMLFCAQSLQSRISKCWSNYASKITRSLIISRSSLRPV